MNKIFLFQEDSIGYALAQDGSLLRAIIDTHPIYFRQGLTNQYALRYYQEHYPAGYEIIDLLEEADPHSTISFAKAYERNQSATTPIWDEDSSSPEG